MRRYRQPGSPTLHANSHRAVSCYPGPAGIVIFRFMLPDLGDIVMFQTHLPLAPALQRCEFRWFADPAIPKPLVWCTLLRVVHPILQTYDAVPIGVSPSQMWWATG